MMKKGSIFLFPNFKDRRTQRAGTPVRRGNKQNVGHSGAGSWVASPNLMLLDEPSLDCSPLATQRDFFEIIVRLTKEQQGHDDAVEQNAKIALDAAELRYCDGSWGPQSCMNDFSRSAGRLEEGYSGILFSWRQSG